MRHLRIIIVLLLALGAQPVLADDGMASWQTLNDVAYGAIFLLLIIIVIALLTVLRAFKILERILVGKEAKTDIKAERAARHEAIKAARAARWNKLLSLKPMSEEHSLILEGEYDGIKELDNPTPAWFMYLFYITIIFGIGYLLVYHVFKLAPLQYDEYKIEMAQAAKDNAAYLAKSADNVNENTVKRSNDPSVLAAGHAIFTQNCTPCHGPQGQGVVGLGPNLTDDYWLHGNRINDVFKTIKYGVQTKGMPTWEKQLTPKQISEVANFVKSLHGTNPPNPKEPQGIKMTDDDAPGKPANGSVKTAALVKPAI
jgi:cytochrome c oxidase cbb3-type subunit 3